MIVSICRWLDRGHHVPWVVPAFMVGIAAPVAPDVPEGSRGTCSAFSQPVPYPRTDVWWDYRVCDALDGVLEVQVRFRNRGPRPVTFDYALYLESPEGCGRDDADPLATGRIRLEAEATTPWPYVRATTDTERYTGHAWVCLERDPTSQPSRQE